MFTIFYDVFKRRKALFMRISCISKIKKEAYAYNMTNLLSLQVHPKISLVHNDKYTH